MASDDEFYVDAAQQRLRELRAMRMRVQANLQTSLSENDREAAAEEIEQIASIDSREAALIALAQREVNRTTPQYREPDTEAEFKAKAAEKMDWNDGLKIVNYGKMPGDPTIVTADDYNRQIAVLRRHKANGKYVDGGN
jgi:hypothetical protein